MKKKRIFYFNMIVKPYHYFKLPQRYPKFCEVCGNRYLAKRRDQKHCSIPCGYGVYEKKKRIRLILEGKRSPRIGKHLIFELIICVCCKKPVLVRVKSKAKTRIYCSRECSTKYNNDRQKISRMAKKIIAL